MTINFFQANEAMMVNGTVQVWECSHTHKTEELRKFNDQALSLLTVCIIVLRNGFTVLGTSACVDPTNFRPEIGRKIAKENAVSQIWAYLGFELASKRNTTFKN